jgi:putative acetyltransferase
MSQPIIKRTTTTDADFILLINLLDHELWNELHEDQATYGQYNKVPGLPTAIVVYLNDEAVACGCFKEYSACTIEIKRMYVKKQYRGQGLSKLLLQELQQWAIQNNYTNAILETSIHFTTARKLYETNGYNIIQNYAPYEGLEESVCMGKQLVTE